MKKIVFSFIFFIIAIAISNGKEDLFLNNNPNPKIEGRWELTYLFVGEIIDMDSIYSRGKPIIHFDISTMECSGSNSCNAFRGKCLLTQKTIEFQGPITTTMAVCFGRGEELFMTALCKKVRHYTLKGDSTLILYRGNNVVMRFVRMKE